MYKITIEATTEKDKETLPLLLNELCYNLESELNIRLKTAGFKWDGRSGGDDSYFGLNDKIIKVIAEVK